VYPELLHIGGFTLYSYGVMMALAFIAAGFVARWQFKKRGVDPDFIFPLLIAAIVGGLLGAKIHYLVIHPEEWPKNLLSGEGLVWFGGLFGAIAAVIIVTLVSHKSLGAVMDAGAVAVPVGYFFGRMGCFLRGCCHGKPTDLPWGLSFPEGIPPTPPGVKVHPTQLYSGVASLVIFALLAWVIGPRVKRQGSLIFVYAVIAGVERFLIEFIRTNEPVALGLTQQQWIAMAMVIIGVVGIYWFETHGKPRAVPKDARSGNAKAVSYKTAPKR